MRGIRTPDLNDFDAFGLQDGVEGGGELRVPVADEMGELCGMRAKLP
ncbi:hypothetical protein ABZ746_34740 [Streptomyces sp. NPDC020096]